MLTTTERLGRTRIRVCAGPPGGRCQVRTAVTRSGATSSALRAVVVDHGPTRARIALVPEGALLLAGDAVEIDVTVGDGIDVDLIEPGGTVAYDMRGGRARWDVRVDLGQDAALRWAGQPFVVAGGADVTRAVRVRCGAGSRLALRETLVLGRYGEQPGTIHQTSTVLGATGRPVLVEDLPLAADTTALLLGGHRVLTTVLSLGLDVAGTTDDLDRYDLDTPGAVLWRRLGHHVHDTELATAWQQVSGADR
ncbi:urease accessory protein UreD [Nocardioides carbamazepini]|uniref:urease accessory protein UreD n=1 Tax=Nocardioides carbamazepini TaxID=2854259 RepID=UPI002149A96E|nr:urease accessory protein UreD [Nocardioides carbamazepini]MCR1780910.1 urease accessory protein UreD [Nocardioides carbamazepini]